MLFALGPAPDHPSPRNLAVPESALGGDLVPAFAALLANSLTVTIPAAEQAPAIIDGEVDEPSREGDTDVAAQSDPISGDIPVAVTEPPVGIFPAQFASLPSTANRMLSALPPVSPSLPARQATLPWQITAMPDLGQAPVGARVRSETATLVHVFATQPHTAAQIPASGHVQQEAQHGAQPSAAQPAQTMTSQPAAMAAPAVAPMSDGRPVNFGRTPQQTQRGEDKALPKTVLTSRSEVSLVPDRMYGSRVDAAPAQQINMSAPLPARPATDGIADVLQTSPIARAEAAPTAELGATFGTAAQPHVTSPVSASPVPVPVETGKAVAAQIATAVQAMSDGTTEIRLNPEELGRVQIRLAGPETGLVVTILTERPETQDLIRRHIDQLIHDFRQNGHQNATFHFAQSERQPQGADTQGQIDVAPEQTENQPAPAPRQNMVADGLDLRI